MTCRILPEFALADSAARSQVGDTPWWCLFLKLIQRNICSEDTGGRNGLRRQRTGADYKIGNLLVGNFPLSMQEDFARVALPLRVHSL